MALRYFFDSYAVIEIIKGNTNYTKFIQEEFVFTVFNLVEIYYSAINDLGEGKAGIIYEKYKHNVIKLNDEIEFFPAAYNLIKPKQHYSFLGISSAQPNLIEPLILKEIK